MSSVLNAANQVPSNQKTLKHYGSMRSLLQAHASPSISPTIELRNPGSVEQEGCDGWFAQDCLGASSKRFQLRAAESSVSGGIFWRFERNEGDGPWLPRKWNRVEWASPRNTR